MSQLTQGTRRHARRPVHRTVAALIVGAMATVGLAVATSVGAAAPAAAQPSGSKDVIAVMFQWPWDAIAEQCTTTLGPAGYGWVQTSPPQEHVQGAQWWTSYQPVSYRIESKLGTRAEFASMVATCRDAGVNVMADAVINHMSGQAGGGTGVAGSPFSLYSYPGTYSDADFSSCRADISDYSNRWQVQSCNLVGLADLATGTTYVRDRIAAYLNDLISLGVRGLRIDAAKHIPAADIAAITSRLTDQSVYIVQEVIGAPGEPVQDSEYTAIGDVHEFGYAWDLKRVFLNEKLAYLSNFGQAWGHLPSDVANVFVDNHDTERNGQTLNQTHGATYTLANVFMLGWSYGTPSVHSGYSFTSSDAGAPLNPDGTVANPTCYQNGWRCQHAWRPIANMVGFHNAVGEAAVTNWWSNANNAIAWGRGSAGYVVINKEPASLSRTFQTSLPAGTYCDVVNGGPTATGCSGATVTVTSSGQLTATVASNDALAIHVDARPGGGGGGTTQSAVSFGVNAGTTWGQSVRVVGSVAALGSWSPAAGVPLSAAGYPVWRGSVNLPAGSTVAYKYVKVDAAGNVVWESGSDRTVTVPASGVLNLDDTWRS